MLRNATAILTVLFFFTVCTVATATLNEPEQKSESQFYLDLYGWMPNIYGESALDTNFELDLDDIIENLQFMIMATPGVKKERWGFEVDVIYLNLGSDKNQTGNLMGEIPVDLYTDVSLKAWIVTPKVYYNLIKTERFNMNILTGARYLYMDVDVKADISGDSISERALSASDSGSVWDGIFGIAGQVTLNEKWYMPYYLDIGTGDSDLTYNLFGGVGYRFSSFNLVAGWRYLRWNFEDNSALENLYVSGPIVGITYRF